MFYNSLVFIVIAALIIAITMLDHLYPAGKGAFVILLINTIIAGFFIGHKIAH